MKNKKIWGAVVTSLCMAMTSPLPAAADAAKVVTLGADLTEEQKDTMLRYFQVSSNQAQIMYITNEDEYEHLGAYVPAEQIGTKTFSCAYVKPTTSGGIQVRTANLNWVTGNMIASTLSTSGVTNCQVVAACPFEVSGTGALTGIIMAYESASGETLDENKKELATQEMLLTGNLADEIGQTDATLIVNEAKMQVLQENVQNAEQIQNIVVNIVQQNNYQISQEQTDEIVNLLQQIAQQDYDYDAMKETLERVDENVSGVATDDSEELPSGEENDQEQSEEPAEEEDGILAGLDESILGENVISSSTEEPVVQEQEEGWEQTEEPASEVSGEEWEQTEEPAPEVSGEEWEQTEEPGWGAEEEPVGETVDEEMGETDGEQNTEEPSGEYTPEDLDEAKQELYIQAEDFCKAVYEGNTEAADRLMVSGILESLDGLEASWDAETGEALSEKVTEAYLEILHMDTASYIPEDGDLYFTPELNMLDRGLKEIFGLNVLEEPQDVLSLAGVQEEERSRFYEATMDFFRELYGETEEAYSETDSSQDMEILPEDNLEEVSE